MAHFQIWSYGVLFIQEQILKAEIKNWSGNANKKYDERLERVLPPQGQTSLLSRWVRR
jgi:hypothetical protein